MPLNSYELELVICGKPFIDMKEWSENTIYKGKYSKSHKVILWFCECLSQHNQQELSKFLQFLQALQEFQLKVFQN